jgi:hypothetical protein
MPSGHKKNPPEWAGLEDVGRGPEAGYFCHVRFLCRLALSRFRRLCFDIFSRRFFFRLPMEEINELSTVLTGTGGVKPIF